MGTLVGTFSAFCPAVLLMVPAWLLHPRPDARFLADPGRRRPLARAGGGGLVVGRLATDVAMGEENLHSGSCHCTEGWICETHPHLPWPHDDCGGPGMPCEYPDCPWWRGPTPAALQPQNDITYARSDAGPLAATTDAPSGSPGAPWANDVACTPKVVEQKLTIPAGLLNRNVKWAVYGELDALHRIGSRSTTSPATADP
jgi:hypothetical protein